MKKIKLVLLAVVLLTTVLLLASCGASSFADLVDREYTPVDYYPAYTQNAAVSALTDMTAGTGAGDLKLFTKYDTEKETTKYIVYDVANDQVVWQDEEEKSETPTSRSTTTYSVSINWFDEGVYFTVNTTNTVVTLEDSVPVKTDVSKSTAVWAWNGSAYAELVKVDEPRGTVKVTQDLLYFEGKVYREDAQTKAVAYAFDYSTLATFPTLNYSTDNYYVTVNAGIFVTYDKDMKQISAFQLPSYAESEASIVLGDKLFIQYFVAEDIYSENYTIFFDSYEKYTLYTVLVDLETTKVKELKSEYLVEDDELLSTSDSWTEEFGLAAVEKEVLALVPVAKIENKRIDESAMATEWAIIDEKGDITVLEVPTTIPVASFYLVAKDTWMLQTVDGRVYIVNGEGEITTEIDYSKVGQYECANYFAANGKLYDVGFNEVYDYQADKLTIVRATRKAFMFTNADGELIIYANGQKTTLINKDAAKDGKRIYSDVYSSSYSGYFVIVDTTDAANTKYEIYNVEGKLIKTVDQTTTFNISAVASAKDGAVRLVKITTWAEGAEKATATYYRFS